MKINGIKTKRELIMETVFSQEELENIRKDLDSEDWQNEGNVQKRSTFLGTVFALTPSGKYYMPLASSNLDYCPCCRGTGTVPGHKSARIRKRNKARFERIMRLSIKNGREYSIRHAKIRTSAKNRYERSCTVCGGIGSKEAYQDELWYEQAAIDLNSIGCSLESGEGDPCDLFAVEYRDNEDVYDNS